MLTLEIIDRHVSELWLVYEHWNDANECIYVGHCRLSSLHLMREPRSNYGWNAHATGSRIRVAVVSTWPDEASAELAAKSLAYERQSICNLANGKVQEIKCSNGVRYPSQSVAAQALGLSQSAISKVLNGRLKRTGGYTFEYVV